MSADDPILGVASPLPDTAPPETLDADESCEPNFPVLINRLLKAAIDRDDEEIQFEGDALLSAVSRLQRERDDATMMLAVWRQTYEPDTYGVLPKSVIDEANAEFNRLAMRNRRVECLDVYRWEPKHEV